jgi:hypothetical protein
MQFKNWLKLDEVHYSDYYGKNFELFRKKYIKQKKNKDLFVQFTNYMDDVLIKKPYEDPNHHDPIAIYGYPLWYVIDYPADIWYGSRAKCLRILQNISPRKTLLLNFIDEIDANNYLRKVGLSTSLMNVAIKHFKIPRGRSQIPKAFFAVIQHDFSNPEKIEEDGETKTVYKQRSGIEQAMLLRKMGFDAFEDRSTNDKKAIINNREPCQIGFLNQQAFKVLEIFDMGGDLKDREKITSKVGTSRDPIIKNERKLAALIAQQLDDAIIEQNLERLYYGGNPSEYYTKNGRLIRIEFQLPSYYTRTRKMGQKKHKEYKFSDQFDAVVTIKGEKKDLVANFGNDVKFDEIAKRIGTMWSGRESLEGHQPYTYSRIEAEKKAGEEAFKKKIQQERDQKIENDEIEMQPELQKALNGAGISLRLSPEKYYYNSFKVLVSHAVVKTSPNDKDEIIQVNRSDVEKVAESKRDSLMSYSEKSVDFLSPEGQKLIDLAVLYLNNPPSKYINFFMKRHVRSFDLKEFINSLHK